MSTTSRSQTKLRWLVRRDMVDVLAIEEECFEFPWPEEDFLRCLRQRNCIGMVAEQDEHVAGFMIYELHQSRIHIVNIAVALKFQRQGIGRAMIDKLKTKLRPTRRDRILLEVREKNLAAQLFCCACGFRAISVLHDFYEDTPEDAYLFQYRVPAVAPTPAMVDAECRGSGVGET